MTAPTIDIARAAPISGLPAGHTIRVGIDRIRLELLEYARRTDNMVFTFAFPILLLFVFASAFGNMDPIVTPDGEISAGALMLPAMVSSGVLLSGTQNLGIGVAIEKWDGTLRRLSAMPIPVTSYFIGKFGQVLITSLVQTMALLAVGVFVFGFDLPQTAAQWGVFAWAYALGLICCAMLGLVLAQLPRSVNAASAVVIPIVLVIQFISGIYLTITMLPDWLIQIASIFPIAWLAHAMRFAFLPEAARFVELDHEWNLGMAVGMLAIWTVVGVIVAAITFRWVKRS
ncbi:ABC transporter permease [uncultured Agrococcus sp.]|uniref:ABC transporter permease n=1 Tax=uncultured Agrococcus sp. TaxID=382258 RepID=UPI0025F36A58|nr:ABC transporter permease [uncultured Agrococcus sp.]